MWGRRQKGAGRKEELAGLCPEALITDMLVGQASCCFQSIMSAKTSLPARKGGHFCATNPEI